MSGPATPEFTPSPELRENYLKWTESALADLRTLLSAFDPSGDDARQGLDSLHAISHNIKGMGASFGYPLMSESGASLCAYLRQVEPAHADVEVIHAHIQSMDVVLSNRLEGDGGDQGAALIQHLTGLVSQAL